MEPTDGIDYRWDRHADPDSGRQRGQGIRGVVFAGQPGGHDRQHLPLMPHREAHAVALDLHVTAVPVGATPKAVGLHAGASAAEEPPHGRVIGAGDQAVLGSEIFEQLAKDRFVGRWIRKDVGMVPIDVCQNGELRGEMQELGPRIEDGRGVFIPLEDEVAAAAPGRRRAEVCDCHAQAATRVAAGGTQDPCNQAGGRRLPGRPGDDDAKAIGRELTPVLGLADQTEMQPPGRVRFRIALAHLVSLNDQVGLPPASHVAGVMAIDPGDSRPGQGLRRWWVGIFIRPGDIVAQLFGNQREAGDRITADADEMDAHQCPVILVIRAATCSAAWGRPREPMAPTILLYRTGSWTISDTSRTSRGPSHSASGMVTAAPAASYGSTLSRWWPPAKGPGTSSMGIPTALTSLIVPAPARLRTRSALWTLGPRSSSKAHG